MRLFKSNFGILIPLFLCLFLISGNAAETIEPAIEWEIQVIGTEASLRGICAVDKNVCWVSGSQGTVARTVNAGKTWQTFQVKGCEDLDFRDVHAFDKDNALILSAGRPGKILKTKNGGADWEETYSNDTEGVFFNSMAFWDASSGIAVGDPIDGRFLLIRTQNGGGYWEEIPFDKRPIALEGEAGFAASGTCIAVFGKGHVWFGTGGATARVGNSDDYGETWTMSETPMQKGQSSQGIFSLSFKDEKAGIIVGGDYQQPSEREGIAARTEDGGSSWIQMEPEKPGGYRSSVAFIPRSNNSYVVMGKEGADITRDGGLTWVSLETDGYYCMSIAPGGQAGWAAGSNGRIVHFVFDD
ncbi:WD40/YVTN/BNR-like repeat-containing protein [Acidobacteriota bacterium]